MGHGILLEFPLTFEYIDAQIGVRTLFLLALLLEPKC